MIDMGMPEDYAGILARLAQMPATVGGHRAKMEPMLRRFDFQRCRRLRHARP
jgi:hypothetical protein